MRSPTYLLWHAKSRSRWVLVGGLHSTALFILAPSFTSADVFGLARARRPWKSPCRNWQSSFEFYIVDETTALILEKKAESNRY